jgi:class 3 adenylate cyclase
MNEAGREASDRPSSFPDWTEAGLYDPASPDAADRLDLLHFLTEQGCTIDEMVKANEIGRLFALAGDRMVRPGRDEFTLREAADMVGADVGLVQRLWQAYGLPIVDPDTKVASRDDVDAMPLFVAMASVVGEQAALGLARVAGAAVAKFADATSAALRSTIKDLAIDTSGSEIATARTFAGLAALTPQAGKALDVLLRHHLEAARRQFEASGSGDVALQRQIRCAVAFADMSGFTALSETVTSDELSRLLTTFETTAADLVHAHDGRIVKFIGDAVMYVTPKAEDAVHVAQHLVESMPHPVRAAVAYGLLLAQDGDYFGPPVNLAARLVATAEPGQVLVTDDLRQRLPGTIATTPTAPQALRGIGDAVVAHAVL